MGSVSIWHWLIVGVVVILLFGGGGKISQIMGDVGKGLKSFKKNVKDDNKTEINDQSQHRENNTENQKNEEISKS